jgi:hypothetical protein
MYLATCRSCATRFCDKCEEAAASLAQTVMHSSENVMFYEPVCPSCGSKDIDHGSD